ncbi:MAG: ArsR family transcriptional regulator [Acidilobaceae archaeon]
MSSKEERSSSFNLRLAKIYEDDDITVAIAPNEHELETIILNIVRERGSIDFKELKCSFSGIVSEDKLKRTLSRLAQNNKIHIDKDGLLYLAEIDESEWA